jgi:hypothetical protein
MDFTLFTDYFQFFSFAELLKLSPEWEFVLLCPSTLFCIVLATFSIHGLHILPELIGFLHTSHFRRFVPPSVPPPNSSRPSRRK